MKHIIILIISLFITSLTSGSTYYVDNIAGADNNSGVSEGQAWKSISKLNSTTFNPGDKILFKRGGSWFELFTLQGHGNPGNPVTIADYGLGPLPVIDGGLTRPQCIVVQNTSYVTVSNLKMQNATKEGAIRILRCSNVTIQNCEFFVTGHGGVFIESSRDCLIKDNKINTQSGLYNEQTDGIYSQRNSNITFDHNYIIILNDHPDPHCDGIQSFTDNNITICNNYIEQNNMKTSHAQGIYATDMSGTHVYYNNVVYCPNTKASVVGFRNLDKGQGFLKLYFNTLVGGGNNILYVSENAGLDAKNNIFYTTGHGTPVHLETGNATLDNNLYYTRGNDKVMSAGQGQSRNLLDMRKEGREIHGINADPMFSKEFRLNTGSPCIDTGMDIGPPFDVDKDGTKRPQGMRPDIGAYEYRQ